MSEHEHYIDDERKSKAMKIRRGIRAARLRVVCDQALGRETPEAVVRLANLRLPELPTDGSREAKAMKIRQGIRAAQLRVALDKARGRETPEAVVRLAELDLSKFSTVN